MTTDAAARPAQESTPARKPFPILLLFCIVGIVLALMIGAVTVSVPLLTLPDLAARAAEGDGGNGDDDDSETAVSPSPSPAAVAVERLEADLLSGFASSSPKYLIVYQDTLVFEADVDGSGTSSLHRYGNGSVSEFASTPTSPSYIVEMDGALYFSGEDSVNGTELWKVASLWSTPTLVEDIQSGSGSSEPAYLTVSPSISTLYFAADSGEGAGRELWQYTVSGGASLVHNLASGSTSSDPKHLAIFNTDLYFSADGGDGSGRELYIYDGVSQPVLVADIADGASSSSPAYLTVVNNLLYFRANGNDGAGQELWVYDGSTAPSRILDYRDGADHGDPRYLISFRSSLLFTATNDDDQDVVVQLNVTNTTAVLSTTTFTSPAYFTMWRSRIYFSADGEDGSGTELWSAGW